MTEIETIVDINQIGKLCVRCKISKPLFLFTVNKFKKSGLTSHCKECDAKDQQKSKAKNKEKNKIKQKEYLQAKRKEFSFRLQMLINVSKQRAVLKGREHTITVFDLKTLWPHDGKCPVFGFELQFNTGGFRETSPSIDRIDSSKGYTLDNIQIISWKANRLKSNATVEELEAVVFFMKQGE